MSYLAYHISIKVQYNEKMEQKIQAVFQNQNGMLFTHDLVKRGIPRSYLSILEKKGEIQRIERGV